MKIATVKHCMLRHIDMHGDPHKIAKEVDEVFQDLIKWAETGECPHQLANRVVTASGDMADRVTGSYCRYCGNRLKIKRIEFEVDGLPTIPRGA